MPVARNAIRADFDVSTLVVYQAFPAAIAEAALRNKRFVSPFSLHRMTWIKPSFLWLMERSNWARKSGQENILSVRITRAGWEEALALGVLTHPEPALYPDPEQWQHQFAEASVHIQWDPERTLRGAAMEQGSIQVGLSRQIIARYVDEWTTDIEDLAPRVHRMRELIAAGQAEKARKLLPPERPYPLPNAIARRIGATITSESRRG